jgi:choline dehydrogenase-like flavoprotein
MDRDPFIHIPAGFANMLVHDRHVWKYETVPQHGTKRAYRSGKVLGGGSSINTMCYVRGQIRETRSPCIPDDNGMVAAIVRPPALRRASRTRRTPRSPIGRGG